MKSKFDLRVFAPIEVLTKCLTILNKTSRKHSSLHSRNFLMGIPFGYLKFIRTNIKRADYYF